MVYDLHAKIKEILEKFRSKTEDYQLTNTKTVIFPTKGQGSNIHNETIPPLKISLDSDLYIHNHNKNK